jgi:hypothetical protein
LLSLRQSLVDLIVGFVVFFGFIGITRPTMLGNAQGGRSSKIATALPPEIYANSLEFSERKYGQYFISSKIYDHVMDLLAQRII